MSPIREDKQLEQARLSYLMQILIKIVIFVFLPIVLFINLIGDFVLELGYLHLVQNHQEKYLLHIPVYVFLISLLVAFVVSLLTFYMIRSIHASQSKIFFLEIFNNMQKDNELDFIAHIKKTYSDESMGYIAELVYSFFKKTQQQEKTNSELLIAQELQDNFLLKDFTAFGATKGQVDLYATLLSARYVGGDFYDCFFLDEEHVLFAIGDACGKSIPACLFTARAISAIRLQAHIRFTDLKAKYEDYSSRLSPARLMTVLNKYLSENNTSHIFLTAGIGILNIKNGEVRYASAGHERPYWVCQKGVKLLDIKKPARPLGLRADSIYEDEILKLAPGDGLFLYTDGILEAVNSRRQTFGEVSLVASLQGRHGYPAKNMIEGIITHLRNFTKNNELNDDIALLYVSWLNQPKTSDIKNIAREDFIDHQSFQMPLNLESLQETKAQLFSFLEKNKLSEEVQHDVVLCLEEYLLNLMHHGKNREDEKISLAIGLTKAFVRVLISDSFPPYDITRLAHKDLSGKYQLQGLVGGRGVKMIMNLADEVHYHTENNKNYLELIKYLRSQ